ncbi:MAG: addiction module protein [Spirochaetia bacterium]|nr:addiction module protein [Spirochaetia bacterium]
MNSQELLKEALSLRPQDKTLLIDGLLASLDEPDRNIDEIWHDEIEKRVTALKNGQLETIPYSEM